MSVSVVRSRAHNGFQADPHTDTVDCTSGDALLVIVGSASGVPIGAIVPCYMPLLHPQ